ncbi:hypothetical protein DH2020_019088 [Rehmannia glutinosa]|uniref:BRO1 domain-containing protein n=1 Tax=Rehmannia glutinosa TaxID=99300 RepID=A0ABR0WKT5_REHGL
MAGQEAPTITRTRRKTATQHGGSTLGDLQALEDYLPVLLGLVKDEGCSSHFSVSTSSGKRQCIVLESRRSSVDVFLKAAGYLDCAVRHVLPQLPNELRRNLPVDLAEGVLRALCLQALGQGVDIQLGLAIDSTKATLAVKRRLACEMVKYWQQAQDNIMNLPLANGWGEKHRLFVKWKYIEAKAAAYYYHGLILDEGNTEKSHGMAVAALQAADEYLKESKKACEAFNASVPVSRTIENGLLALHNSVFKKNLIFSICRRKFLHALKVESTRFAFIKLFKCCPRVHESPLWGTMKYLSEKIPKDTSSKDYGNGRQHCQILRWPSNQMNISFLVWISLGMKKQQTRFKDKKIAIRNPFVAPKLLQLPYGVNFSKCLNES